MPKVSELFAFVAEEKDADDEGIVGMLLPTGMWMPLVGADMARVDSLRPIAKHIAKTSGQKIKLLRFSVREELETILPELEGG